MWRSRHTANLRCFDTRVGCKIDPGWTGRRIETEGMASSGTGKGGGDIWTSMGKRSHAPGQLRYSTAHYLHSAAVDMYQTGIAQEALGATLAVLMWAHRVLTRKPAEISEPAGPEGFCH